MKKIVFALLACSLACQSQPQTEKPAEPVQNQAVTAKKTENVANLPPAAEAVVPRLTAVNLPQPVDALTTQRGLSLKASFLAGERLQHRSEDYKSWIALAASAEQPSVVATALVGMMRTYYSAAPENTDDYKAVLLARLSEKDAEVVSSAIFASLPLVSLQTGTDEKLAEAIEQWLQPEKDKDALTQKLAAIRMLYNFKGFRSAKAEDAAIKELLVKKHLELLASENTSVLALALDNLYRVRSDLELPLAEQTIEQLIRLEKHADAEIAALAYEAHVQYADEQAKKELSKTIEAQLNNVTNAFAKSIYASCLVDLNAQQAIPSVGKLLDLSDDTRFEIKGAMDVEAHQQVKLSPFGIARLDMVALWALKQLSSGSATPFTYGAIVGKQADQKRAEAIASAREWLAHWKP